LKSLTSLLKSLNSTKNDVYRNLAIFEKPSHLLKKKALNSLKVSLKYHAFLNKASHSLKKIIAEIAAFSQWSVRP
jgi:hypothetical protein